MGSFTNKYGGTDAVPFSHPKSSTLRAFIFFTPGIISHAALSHHIRDNYKEATESSLETSGVSTGLGGPLEFLTQETGNIKECYLGRWPLTEQQIY